MAWRVWTIRQKAVKPDVTTDCPTDDPEKLAADRHVQVRERVPQARVIVIFMSETIH